MAASRPLPERFHCTLVPWRKPEPKPPSLLMRRESTLQPQGNNVSLEGIQNLAVDAFVMQTVNRLNEAPLSLFGLLRRDLYFWPAKSLPRRFLECCSRQRVGFPFVASRRLGGTFQATGPVRHVSRPPLALEFALKGISVPSTPKRDNWQGWDPPAACLPCPDSHERPTMTTTGTITGTLVQYGDF